MPPPLGLSYRRVLIDAELERLAPTVEGVVLEIGAKRVRRGRWVPPVQRARRWLRLNIDSAERPDVVADAAALPLRGGSVDWIVCVEVLQYVAAPDTAAREMGRVLVPGGALVLAVPFLHRVDGPADRHRFTETRVRELLESAGLRIGALSSQGRLFGTVANQVRQAVAHIPSRPLRWLAAAGVVPLAALLLEIDRLAPVRRSSFLGSFTTGYVALARKAA